MGPCAHPDPKLSLSTVMVSGFPGPLGSMLGTWSLWGMLVCRGGEATRLPL